MKNIICKLIGHRFYIYRNSVVIKLGGSNPTTQQEADQGGYFECTRCKKTKKADAGFLIIES